MTAIQDDEAVNAIEDLSDLSEDFLWEEQEEEKRIRLQTRHKSRRADAGSERSIERILAESDGLEELITTYKPSRHELGWLLSSLRDFYQQNLISDVLASVKGGKEASVYRCRTAPAAVPVLNLPLLAAKVYRPRNLRNLRNDAQYRQGRPVLTADGKQVKPSDTRIMRALGKKTDFAVQVQHTSWLMYEYTTLETLHRAGAAVPRPIAASENALLMEYVGSEDAAAPTLIETGLREDEAHIVFKEVLRNLRLLLEHDMIHGDLSAYNILYWDGKVTLIDFPQVVNVETNPDAETLFYRDVQRVCDYFTRQGVRCEADRVARDLWRS